ncbi:hypothetical protein Syun_024838 [Stephania yunnanensis]|uniref:Ubiquitin-like domain-containing protein n=1 Tax=Stephania yunnanensis TaxID=152371 RepID=A0AAP0EXM0_9MAGN
MIINVITLTGKKMTFEIDGSHKLRHLQLAIQAVDGIPPSQQKLSYAGVHLLGGSLVHQIEKISLETDQTRPSHNSSINIWLSYRLRGGGNQIFHRPLLGSDDDEDEDDDDDEVAKDDKENLIKLVSVALCDPKSEAYNDRNGGRYKVGVDQTAEIPRRSSFDPESDDDGDADIGGGRPPKEPKKKFGQLELDSESTDNTLLNKFITSNEKGTGSNELNKEPDSNRTNALYHRGIDQIIEGLYSLELYKSRMDSENGKILTDDDQQNSQVEQLSRMVSATQLALDERNKEVLTLKVRILELEAELANLKTFQRKLGTSYA